MIVMKTRQHSLICSILIAALTASSALAQNAAPPVEQKSVSEQRIGVDPSQRKLLTLRDAITMALENNRDIEVERFNVQLNEFDLRAAEGVYDPVLNSSFYYDRRTTPVASILAGGQNGRLLTDNLVSSASITQRLPWQGGNVSAGFDNNRATTQNLFNSLNPQYTTGLTFNLTQPLWRNRAIDAPPRQLRISSHSLDL